MQIPLTVFLELIVIIGLEADHDLQVYHLCQRHSASELKLNLTLPFFKYMRRKVVTLKMLSISIARALAMLIAL
jgi:hypothetical protein